MMKKFSKFAGGLGLIFILFGGPASILFSGIFQTLAMIQLFLGLIGLGIFLFYSLGETMSAIAQKRSAIFGIVGGLLIFLILIGINVVAHSKFGERKWDTTTNRIHSLSPESEAVLKTLNQSITLFAFMDRGQREREVIKNLVEKYQYVSNKLKLEVLDPNEEPALMKDLGAGVGEVVLRNDETKRTIKLATATEEALTNALKRVLQTTQKTIYFLQGQGQAPLANQEDTNGIYIGKLLLEAEGFKVMPLNLAQAGSIPKDAALVSSWGAQRPISQSELSILENYLARGGLMVIGQDPIIAATKDKLVSSGFNPLLEKYGLQEKPDILVEVMQLGPFGKKASIEFLAYTYSDHPIVAKIGQDHVTQFAMASPVLALPNYKGPAKIKPLVSTSTEAWAESNIKSLFNRDKGAAKNTQEGDLAGPLPIAQIAEWKVEKPTAEDFSPDGRLVVFGNAAFASDRLIQAQYNRDLFLNAFAFLIGDTGSSLSIRPKTWTQSTLEMSDSQRVVVYYASLFVIPQLLLILSLFVWLVRRSRT